MGGMPTDIQQVIRRLDVIVAWAIRNEQPLGLFAAMYRQVTLQVAQGIAEGSFDDGARMDRFDTRFANRYFRALESWRHGKLPTAPWQAAFGAPRRSPPMLHLLLGMNAHIGLDLPVSAARVGGAQVAALGADFERINDILFGLIDGMQQVLDDHSRAMWGLDLIAGDWDERAAAGTLRLMRVRAWDRAVELAQAPAWREPWDRKLLASSVAFEGLVLRRAMPRRLAPLDLGRMIAELDRVAQEA